MAMFNSVSINLDGPTGNAFCIMAAVKEALKTAEHDDAMINCIIDDMMSSDYEHLCDVAEKVIVLQNRKSEKIS